MISADVLVVASLRRWVADDFAGPAAARGLPVLHSFGLDLPDLSGYAAPAWWLPLGHAAVLRRHGVDVPLVAPGPDWLGRVPTPELGRRVWSGTLADLAAGSSGWSAGYAKLAEAKAEDLPAAWTNDLAGFVADARAAGVPDESWVQVSDTYLDLDVEVRCFTVARDVLTTSPYLVHTAAGPVTWSEHMVDDSHAFAAARDGARYAGEVLAALPTEVVPPAMTLDVARDSTGRWLVLEANPVSSSAAYGADMDAVLTATLAGTDLAAEHPRWAWRPDPYLVERAARHRPLYAPVR
jgi:hypothetical protein